MRDYFFQKHCIFKCDFILYQKDIILEKYNKNTEHVDCINSSCDLCYVIVTLNDNYNAEEKKYRAVN